MESSEELSDEQFWKNKISKHWKTFLVIIIAGIVAAIGALIVFIWFTGMSPLGRQGTATFNEWRMHWVVGFIILLTLSELVFVGIPAGLFFGVGGYLWWRRLPDEEKQEFKDREKKRTHVARDAGGGGGFSFFFFIAYCIYLAFDGHYNIPFGNEPYTYWIFAGFYTIMWLLIYIGIPVAVILLIVYFTKWRKKPE
jgi:hypothetical protein